MSTRLPSLVVRRGKVPFVPACAGLRSCGYPAWSRRHIYFYLENDIHIHFSLLPPLVRKSPIVAALRGGMLLLFMTWNLQGCGHVNPLKAAFFFWGQRCGNPQTSWLAWFCIMSRFQKPMTVPFDFHPASPHSTNRALNLEPYNIIPQPCLY